jgi:hypothetical protein
MDLDPRIVIRDERTGGKGRLKPPSPVMSLFFGRFFPAGFILIGGLTLFLGLREMMAAQKSTKWPAIPGTVKSSGVEWSSGSSHDAASAYAKVVYTYEVGGRLHTSDKVLYGDYGSSDSSHADSIASQYTPGRAVTVYYDPTDPSTAVLKPGINGGCLFLPIFGGVFLLTGLALAWFLPSVLSPFSRGISDYNQAPNAFPPAT